LSEQWGNNRNRQAQTPEAALPREIERKSRFDLCISSREICISVLHLYIPFAEICISVREICISVREIHKSPEELGDSPKESGSATKATGGPTSPIPHPLLWIPISHLLLGKEKAALWCAWEKANLFGVEKQSGPRKWAAWC